MVYGTRCNTSQVVIMCILFMHVNPDAKEGEYRLIIAANRDEYYRRPAEYANNYGPSGVIGGRDMEAGREGGMWLGMVSKKHESEGIYCFSAILNITGERFSNAEGRGTLVRDYLHNKTNADEYVKSLKRCGKVFNGYNFVAVELGKNNATTFHLSNTPMSENVFTGKQTLGFGNSPLASPLKKVEKGKAKFQMIIESVRPQDELIEELLQLLQDEERHLPDNELQSRAPNAYLFLSSIFVKIEEAGYGTRAHSIILVDYNWNLIFKEYALEQPIRSDNLKWKVNTIKSNL